MYNYKFPKNEKLPPSDDDPFKSNLLRIWIVTGGTFVIFAGMIETGAGFKGHMPSSLIISFVVIAILYLMDVYAEAYKAMQYVFVIIALILGMVSVGFAVHLKNFVLFLTFIYGFVAAVLAFVEYDF